MTPYLQKYPDKIVATALANGFKNGSPLCYEGPIQSYVSKNLKSALEHKEIVHQKINNEISNGRVEGPFKYPHFKHFRVSPIGLVPKKDPG